MEPQGLIMLEKNPYGAKNSDFWGEIQIPVNPMPNFQVEDVLPLKWRQWNGLF